MQMHDNPCRGGLVRRGHQVEISSSDIRNRVAEGRSIRYLVPTEVEDYIQKYGLYAHDEKH
ncbi:MAG: hypothetical protein AAF492_31055, partial [Verrucomicrobiota bacterium]